MPQQTPTTPRTPAARAGTADDLGPPRSGWRYGELHEDDVVRAALRFARHEGLANLTMRKLATELGVSPTSAYYHVPSKEALFDLAADAVLGEVPEPPPETRRWDEKLRFLFMSARRLLLRYPGVSDHLLVRTGGAPQQMRLYLLTKQILAGAGFDETAVNHAQRTLAYLLFGAVSQELATSRRAGDRPGALRFADDDEAFAFGLDAMLDGLAAQRRRARAAQRRAPRARNAR